MKANKYKHSCASVGNPALLDHQIAKVNESVLNKLRKLFAQKSTCTQVRRT